MKHLIIVILSLFAINHAQAVEYFTLSKNDKTRNLASNSIVEIVGYSGTSTNSLGSLEFTLANGDTFTMPLLGALDPGTNRFAAPFNSILGSKFTEVTGIELTTTQNVAVTLKVTPAAEINPVSPNTFLVMPEGSTGNFDVILESSNDLTNWNPFTSQTVSGSTSPTFFRARIVQAPE
ncbi:MAG: hypothetical protein ACSHX4_10585 [Opitutaceae bacterium]